MIDRSNQSSCGCLYGSNMADLNALRVGVECRRRHVLACVCVCVHTLRLLLALFTGGILLKWNSKSRHADYHTGKVKRYINCGIPAHQSSLVSPGFSS